MIISFLHWWRDKSLFTLMIDFGALIFSICMALFPEGGIWQLFYFGSILTLNFLAILHVKKPFGCCPTFEPII